MYPDVARTFTLSGSIMTLVLFTLFMFGLAFALVNRKKSRA